MKDLATVMLAASVTLAVSSFARAETVLKIATVIPEGPAAEVQGFKAFKTYVESRSNGEIKVRAFFQTLGGERELTEQVRQGTLEVALVADGAFGGFYKPIQVFSIPYLFDSSPVAWELFRSPFARELASDIREKTGIRVLTFAENGFRNFTNNVREIRTPDDMKGLKMRTMESPVYMTFVQSLGASATPISGAEVALALKQGVVDGQENATGNIADTGTADVQKFMSVNEHILGVHLVIINDAFYNALPRAHQEIVADGAQLYATFTNARKLSTHQEALDKIKGKGLKIHMTTGEEKARFRALSQAPVKQYIEGQVGKPLVDKLLAAAAEARDAVYPAAR